MIKTKLKRGLYVKVYQKPMTMEDYEGIGKIVGPIHPLSEWEGAGYEVAVSFRDEPGPFIRRVHEPIEIIPASVAGF